MKKGIPMVLLIGLTICWLYLFYRQALLPTDYTRIGMPYGSDLSFHIKFALENSNHYSIYYYLLAWINRPFGGVNPIGTSLFLTSILLLTFFVNYFFFRKNEFEKSGSMYLSILLLFTASIAVPVIFPFFYFGQLDTQPWHNGPYFLMRLFAFPMLLAYYSVKKEYMKQMPIRQLCIFIVFSVMCCVSKPSFIMAFYPVMFGSLVVDLIKTKAGKIDRQFWFGLSVCPSLGILFYQYMVSFMIHSGSALSNDQNGIQFGLIQPVDEVVVTSIMKLLFGLAFPLYVFWSSHWESLKKPQVATALIIYLTAYAETLLLHETGTRANDGNFGWGMPISAYILLAYCLCEFFRSYNKREKWDRAMGIILLGAHYVTGFVYFILIILGEEAPSLM